MSTVVSNHQLPLLRHFIENKFSYLNIEHAQEFDQRGFRSFLIRKYIAYRPGHGFHITSEGKKAWEALQNTEIWRADPSRPLTRYFDYVAYGLADPRQRNSRRKLRVVHSKGAA